MPIGLRVDVDTWRGTRQGLPRLLSILERRRICATWYLTLGPDNMGRHAWRLLRPAFAMKMLKSRAASLYGWDILLRGTLWPGPVISRGLREQLRLPLRAGQEVGLHAWDHHRWQVGVERLPDEALEAELSRAVEAFVDVLGVEPATAAAPGWRFEERVLALPASRTFAYRSDCRGPARAFHPRLGGKAIAQPQVPVDLPTYDESTGGPEAFHDDLLGRVADGANHVLTVHAESEGGATAPHFERFLDRALASGHRFVPLRDMAADAREEGSIGRGAIPGREGWVCVRTDILPGA